MLEHLAFRRRRDPLHLRLLAALLAATALACGEQPAPAGNRPLATSQAAATTACEQYDCNPGGAHTAHAAYPCRTCHMMHGPSRFDPAGPAAFAPTAARPTPPAPTFDPVHRTCSNVACHSVPEGTFSYTFPGGDGEPELRTVTYGGAGVVTPSWYATGGLGCTGCHGNPPAGQTWHGQHAGGPTALTNQCALCHPDATGSGGVGTAITVPALHRNGIVEVRATFKSSCFGCH